MIFRPDFIEAVLSGDKTVTRRRAKLVPNLQPDGWDGRRDGMVLMPCRYREGRTYSVQPGYATKGVGRILIRSTTFEEFDPLSISEEEAHLEGCVDASQFRMVWTQLHGHLDPIPVWRIQFDPAPVR